MPEGQSGAAQCLAMAQAAQAQIEQLVSRLQHEGVLDEQFVQLMMLQDDSNPDFVMEVVQLFFEVGLRW